MSKKQHAIKLTPDERQELERFVTRGKKNAREITRARILLLTQDGRPVPEIARTLGISRGTIYNVYKRYQRKPTRAPLVAALEDEPRTGRPLKLDSRVEATVTMIACSAPPTGRARWTLHLIADKLVRLGVTEAISHESVRQAKFYASRPHAPSWGESCRIPGLKGRRSNRAKHKNAPSLASTPGHTYRERERLSAFFW